MKKLFALLCVLSLLLGILPAGAEELSPVYMLMSMTPDGEQTPLGTAVLMGDSSTLVTTQWAAMADSGLYAVGSGGVLAIARVHAPASGSDLVTLTLREPSPAQPIELGEVDSGLHCVGLRRGETAVSSIAVQDATFAAYEHAPCLLFTGLDGMLPGAVLLNGQGQLVGLTMAAYGEGISRHVAYTVQTLQEHLAGTEPVNRKSLLSTQAVNLSGLEVAAGKGELMVSWAHLDAPEQPEGSALYLVWQDTANPFLSYVPVAWEDGQAELPVVPGRSYKVWLQQSLTGEVVADALSAASAVRVDVAQAEPFTAYGFYDQVLYLTFAPMGQEYEETEQVPSQPLSIAALMDENAVCYLQAISVYEVAEQQYTDLVIALYAPDGSVYADPSGFLFLPEVNGNDVWHADITALVWDCLTYVECMPGDYTLAYYLDGQLATAFTFSLE